MSGFDTVKTIEVKEFSTAGVASSGSVTFTGLPTDEDTITIDDGVNTAVEFEFDDDSSLAGAGTQVDITGMTTPEEVAEEFKDMVNAEAATLDILATRPADSAIVILVSDAVGVAGNEALAKSAGLAEADLVGLAGGLDAATLGTVDSIVKRGDGSYSFVAVNGEKYIIQPTHEFEKFIELIDSLLANG